MSALCIYLKADSSPLLIKLSMPYRFLFISRTVLDLALVSLYRSNYAMKGR